MAKRKSPQNVVETRQTGDFHYHYSREERLESANESTRNRMGDPKKLSWFKRNRSQAITLGDIAIIAIVVFFLMPLINSWLSRTVIAGLEWNARVYELEDNLFLSLIGEGQLGSSVVLDVEILQGENREPYLVEKRILEPGNDSAILFLLDDSYQSPLTIVLSHDQEQKELIVNN